eukprot:6316606-Prymnesium_polylepis.1
MCAGSSLVDVDRGRAFSAQQLLLGRAHCQNGDKTLCTDSSRCSALLTASARYRAQRLAI